MRIDIGGEVYFTSVEIQLRSEAVESLEVILRSAQVFYVSINLDDGRRLVIPGVALRDALFFVEEV